MAKSAYSPAARSLISRHVEKYKKAAMPQKQAVAAAMSESRRKGLKTPAKRVAPKNSSAKRTTKARKTSAKRATKSRKT